MLFRPATSDDLDTLNALVESAYRGDSARRGWTHEADLLDGQRTDREALAETIADPAQHLLVADDEGTLAGCICVTEKPGALAYVGLVTVDPARQGGGLGRDLLDAGEAAARAAGATRAEMTVIRQRAELIAWYERRGYALTGERRPFPHGDARFGLPKTDALEFVVLEKPL
ncbi:GNAT family N-acetyltransferase [Sphingomonas sp. ASV193]|uniref:GNAT family N-acetyltransferase n=1 Tax=Sphingomonas sp. ASV193 TaxID=3144405 RepID=UPI0032E8AD6C